MENPYGAAARSNPNSDPEATAEALRKANVIDGRAAAGNKNCKKLVAASRSQSMTQAAIASPAQSYGAGSYMEEEEEEIQM